MDLRNEQLLRVLDCIASDTKISLVQVSNTVKLILEGGTVPFIARYRKEVTNELDEVAVRAIEKKHKYYLELENRKNTILASIESQDKLSDELCHRIENTISKTELEDLYLPFKPKRRTKATIARENGLEPLANIIFAQDIASGLVDDIAADFIDEKVPDTNSALQGAAYILAERLCDNADAREMVRQSMRQEGVVTARVAPKFSAQKTKFEMYYDYQENYAKIPSHRMLAMRRGMDEGVLFLAIEAPSDLIISKLESFLISRDSIFTPILKNVAADTYQRLLSKSIELELFSIAKAQADDVAIKVFADNLKNLLLTSPAGDKTVLGIDPGLRTGSKCVIVDVIGRFLAHKTIYPHTGADKLRHAIQDFKDMLQKWKPELIAVGNGTGGRQMELFAKQVLASANIVIPVIMVSESGASIYSASDIAREEFPELDLTIRGAISIARRLQDPLAELVKLDPKNIGVGQYQHDVNQLALHDSLDNVVESCVNFVGVELNTASWPLLSHVSGIGPNLAKSIVNYRNQNGPFAMRSNLRDVPRFGAKVFEQAAGFLRIRKAQNVLDNTAVHPERYPLVQQMAADLGLSVQQLLSSSDNIDKIKISNYKSDHVGMPTLRDILAELKKPGRDPRAQFIVAQFRDDVTEVADLAVGMILQGSVTNVTNFGAFVDVGVHQDGLVHISHLANKFVDDPNDVVQVGMIVKVKVLSIDKDLNRISLSIRDALKSEKSSNMASIPKKSDKTTSKKKVNKVNKVKPSAKNIPKSPFDGLDDLF